MEWRHYVVILGVLGLILALSPGVRASVLVIPARLEAVAAPDGSTPGLVVYNRGSEAVEIRFSLMGSGHDLDGMPVFDEREEIVAWLSHHVHVTPAEVYLRPGESRRIDVRVSNAGTGGLYPAILIDIEPERQESRGVASRIRIAVPALITFRSSELESEPTAAKRGVKVVDLHVDQAGAGAPVRMEAVLINTGDRHVRAGARVEVDGSGTRDEILLPAVTILPGAARRVAADWAPVNLPSGRYSARIIPDEGSIADAMTVAFDVIRPYEVARARFDITDFIAHEPTLKYLPIRTVVINRGNVSGSALLEVAAMNANGQAVTGRQWEVADLAPATGRVLTGELDVEACPPGEYRLIARIWQDGKPEATAEYSVRLLGASLAAVP